MKLQTILILASFLLINSHLSSQAFTIHNEGNAPTSSQTLAIDDDNRIWVAQTTAFSGNLDYFHNGEWTILGWEDKNLMSARATDMIINADIIELGSYGGLAKIDWKNEIFDVTYANGTAIQCVERNTVDNILYKGTNKLNKYSNGQWEEISEISRPITIYFDEETNSTWVGSQFFGGIYKIQDGVITNYNDNFKDVFDLEVDSEGNVWMVIEDKGLVKFDGETFTYFNESNSNLLNNNPEVLTIDHLDNIWIGGYSYGGVSYFDKSSFTNYDYNLSQIPTRNIRQMKVGQNNDLWMATDRGLMQFSTGDPLGIHESEYQALVCYPNPFTSFIRIQDYGLFNNYEIFSSTGIMVKRGIVNSEPIDMHMLSKGLYTIRLIGDKQRIQVSKILKD